MVEQPQPTRDELVSIAVQQAALASEGSFADRNPTLGKMVRCPYCGRRRREQEVCCSPKYVVTTLADVPRSAYAKKRKVPRLSRNRPPLAEIHQRLLEMEAKPEYHEYDGVSGVVEQQIIRRKKSAAKKKRDQQKRSRKINKRK